MNQASATDIKSTGEKKMPEMPKEEITKTKEGVGMGSKSPQEKVPSATAGATSSK